jgi:hypothetical protein
MDLKQKKRTNDEVEKDWKEYIQLRKTRCQKN